MKACLFSAALAVASIAQCFAWDGGLEGGAVIRDGKNATRLRLKLFNSNRPLSQSIHVDWIRDEDGENSYEAGYVPRYWLENNLYLFGEARLRVDESISIDRETQIVAGIGTQFIQSEQQSLMIEAGIGQRVTEFTTGGEADEAFALGRTRFQQLLSEFLRLELDGEIKRSESLLDATAEAGISLSTATGVIKISHRVRRLEPDGVEGIDDSDTTVSFGYNF